MGCSLFGQSCCNCSAANQLMVVGLNVCDLTVYSQETENTLISDLLEETMIFN